METKECTRRVLGLEPSLNVNHLLRKALLPQLGGARHKIRDDVVHVRRPTRPRKPEPHDLHRSRSQSKHLRARAPCIPVQVDQNVDAVVISCAVARVDLVRVFMTIAKW